MEVTFHRLIPRDLKRAIDYYESEGGYRRTALATFPYHFLYEIDSFGIWIAILRHDRRHPSYGLNRKGRS